VHATEWTIMVYMNADNNLECFGMQDLQEMVTGLRGISASDMPNVVVLSDRGPEQCDGYIDRSALPNGVRITPTLSLDRDGVHRSYRHTPGKPVRGGRQPMLGAPLHEPQGAEWSEASRFEGCTQL
jgi:hypothetical protein